MFGVFLWIVFIIGVISLIVVCVWDKKKINCGSTFLTTTISVICVLLISFSIIVGATYISAKEYYASPDNYYETLLQKQEIISKLKTYKEEIHNVLSGDVAIIDFTKQEELVKLNSQIKDYNYKIIKHRGYKESFWLPKLYNKDIANLELFTPIFNVQEE